MLDTPFCCGNFVAGPQNTQAKDAGPRAIRPGKVGFPMARKASVPASASLEKELRELQKQTGLGPAEFVAFVHDALLRQKKQKARRKKAHKDLTGFLAGFLLDDANIDPRGPEKGADAAQTGLKSEVPLPIHYPHTSVPEHATWLVAEGKFQEAKAGKTGGVVFDNGHTKLLFDALADPDHQHRQRAVQLVRRFGAAVEKEKAQELIKDKGIVMEQASRKYGVPASTLRDWQELGLLTVLYRGKGKQGIYLDEAAVARAASIYEEARQKGIQPTRLLKAELDEKAETRPQLDQSITARTASREFNVPINFLLRWAKELGAIPILSEGTGRGSATYLDREKARKASELYHEAKRQKIQPKKLLERLSS